MTTTEGAYRRLADLIATRSEATAALTQRLLTFRSVNPKFLPEGSVSEEGLLQAHIAELARAWGCEVHTWDALPGRPNVVAIRRGTGGSRSLALNGHVDVVPPSDLSQWEFDPWEGRIIGNRLHGRGSSDMKDGVAAMLLLMQALHELQVMTRGDLQFHFVVDEEGGGEGTKAVLANGYRPDAVIVTESSRGNIVVAHGGLEWVRVTLTGQTAHAGWRYSQIYPQAGGVGPAGVNAIEKGWRLLGSVRELEREWAVRKSHPMLPPGITTINPGVFVGGVGQRSDGFPETLTNPAIVPDTCVLEFDLKYLPTETPDGIRAEFEAFVEAFARTDPWLTAHPPTVKWGVRGVAFPPAHISPAHELVRTIREGVEREGRETACVGSVGVCDVAFYAGVGVPGVVFGPTGAGAHGENEYVELDSIIRAAQVYAHTVAHWCEVQE